MKNVERRGERFRAQIYSRGVRLSKTFASEAEAGAWLCAQRLALVEGARLSPLPTNRRRTDYATVTFSAMRGTPLESVDSIIAAAQPREKVCGVYFLIAGGSVVYVGQSTDVHYRVAYHAQFRAFESYHVIPCPESEACLLESRYILAINPPWNRGRDGALVLSVHRGALRAA